MADLWPDLDGEYTVRLSGDVDDVIYFTSAEAAEAFIAKVNAPDLPECPEWAVLMPVATGAALKANDPDEEWERERWEGAWSANHERANTARRYPIRRATPPEPQTERVPLDECLGREVLVDGERRVIEAASSRHRWANWFNAHGSAHEVPVAPDGTVEVLVASGDASAAVDGSGPQGGDQ